MTKYIEVYPTERQRDKEFAKLIKKAFNREISGVYKSLWTIDEFLDCFNRKTIQTLLDFKKSGATDVDTLIKLYQYGLVEKEDGKLCCPYDDIEIVLKLK